MKNKSTLSLIFWLLAATLGILYFVTDKESRESKAISKTRLATKKLSDNLFEKTVIRLENYIFETGKNSRDMAIVNKMRANRNLLDSVRKYSQLDWKELKTKTDTNWIKLPSFEVTHCVDCSSKKVEKIHQNLLYNYFQFELV